MYAQKMSTEKPVARIKNDILYEVVDYQPWTPYTVTNESLL